MKNNLLNKGSIVPILLGIIALLVIVGGIYIYSHKKVEAPIVVNESEEVGLDNQQEITPIDTTVKSTNTKSFKLGTLEFSYPDILTLSKEGEQVTLSHSIPQKHQNRCDFVGDAPTLNEINDFGVSFKIVNSKLIDTLVEVPGAIKGSTVVLQPGFVDKYVIGSLEGYKIYRGLEACGENVYYLSVSPTQTLVVYRSFYAQTVGQTTDAYMLKLPGIISKAQEESIFQSILSSVTGLPNQKTLSIKVFFPNSVTDPGFMDCNVVRSTTRVIPYTLATANASLIELIKGPTVQELSQGFQTQIDSNTTIKSLSIKNGTAYVDFSKELQNKNVGLCAGQFIDAQIRQTLLQFPTIKNAVISIEGNKDFVQP